MQWFGKPVPQNRFLGQVDQDDPTNLPMGLAALCRNFDFTRDSGGPTCATTRAGINKAMQCLDPAAPVTGALGFVYSPVDAADALLVPDGPYTARIQRPLLFQPTQGSQYEFPLGTGKVVKLPATNFTEPQTTGTQMPHKIDASAGNRVFGAYSDLSQPMGPLSNIDPKALTMNPFGMKPFGYNWTANTAVLAGEVWTPSAPSTGNGHTYQAQNSGNTGADEPDWPLTDGGTVTVNGVTWKEKTMVIANRLSPPATPLLFFPLGHGAIPAGSDVYVVITLLNAAGESLPSTPTFITTDALHSLVAVQIPALAALPSWMQGLTAAYVPTQANVYVAIVATGSPAPALSDYQQLGASAPLGTNVNISAAGTGNPPPTVCTARVTPGQLPTPTTQPILDRNPGAGTFPAGRDVYVLKTYTNALGETPAGPANSIVNTNASDAVQVTVDVPTAADGTQLFSIAQVGLYEADVPTGTPAPPSSAFRLVGYFDAGATASITTTAAGSNPPLTNTTGPGGNITADTAAGGANGTQGYRYAGCMWLNQMQTISGFTRASVVKTIIDEDGWEIGAFNIPTGMPNVVGRIIPFSGADASQSGPFNWLGLVNLDVPSQNVVYPMQTPVNGVNQSATVILDNVTTSALFNFTDDFLASEEGNNVDDRLSITAPPVGCRVDYLASVNRLAVTGVPGLASGVWISLAADYESFDSADSPVPIIANGERCFGVTDKYKGILFAIMEEGGFVIQANTGTPNSWQATRRWSGMGACGFRAWDCNGKFIIFAHRSGLYKYDESDPDMMTKEVPKMWDSINWAAASCIAVTIDEDTHTVRVLVPTGASTVPNQEFSLSYIEGWQNPIHFSTFSGKEISMDAARRWSFNDVSSFVCLRMLRTLPAGGNAFIDGPSWNTLPSSNFQLSQLLYASSGADGTVQARTPGYYEDNGGYIDWQYETMSSGMMQALCKPEGFNLNAVGWGNALPSFVASRAEVSDEGGENKLIVEEDELPMEPIALNPRQIAGITRKCAPSLNEYWRVRIRGDRQPGTWISLKALTPYVIPFTGGRDPGDR